ncbi:MAG: hypothetical protein KAS32_05775 [Candidatus Peribacteraceae bacterium]|nr:hypothetical protein [Candidatus Peribacteraceae bacterium]
MTSYNYKQIILMILGIMVGVAIVHIFINPVSHKMDWRIFFEITFVICFGVCMVEACSRQVKKAKVSDE